MERQRNETTSQARRGEYGEDVKKTFGFKWRAFVDTKAWREDLRLRSTIKNEKPLDERLEIFDGGAGVSVLRFLFTLKFALTFCFCAEKCLIWLDDLQNKNILQTAKNGNPILFMVKNGNVFWHFTVTPVSGEQPIFTANHYHSLPYITITAFQFSNNLILIYHGIDILQIVLSKFWCPESPLMPVCGNRLVQCWWI